MHGCSDEEKGSFVSDKVLREARKTLCLLLPSNQPAVTNWYKRNAAMHDLDTSVLRSHPLTESERDISKFTYFRDRLITLKRHYDSTIPSSPKQFWYDRRDFRAFLGIMTRFLISFLLIIIALEYAVLVGMAIWNNALTRTRIALQKEHNALCAPGSYIPLEHPEM